MGQAGPGRLVIVAYRPKPGAEANLKALLATHVPRLRELGLVTARTSILMEAADNTFVEVFEWASAEAIDAAHGHPAVQAMWSEFAEVCDYIPIAEVPEATQLFSEFAAAD